MENAVNSSLPAGTPYASVNPLQIWTAIGTFVWLCGIAALLLYSVVSLFLLNRKLRGATYPGGNLYISENLTLPFVMGVFRPKIYLPAHLTEEEKEYILLHERTHIRRFDPLFKIIGFAVLCLHWFNPLVWTAFFLCGNDMEMSCDEAIIQRLGGNVAANTWLQSLSGSGVPDRERIKDFTIEKISVITGAPKDGESFQEMKYHYVVQVDYSVTTDSDPYVSNADSISGKGIFQNLFRELCVKVLENGSFEIVSVGTGGGEQEFLIG